MTGRVFTFLLTLAILLVTLQDFYDFNQGMPIFAMAGTGLYLLLVSPWLMIERQDRKLVPITVILMLVLMVVLSLASTLLVPLRGGELQMKTPIGFITGQIALGLTLLSSSRATFRSRLLQALEYITYIHLGAFFLQVLFFILTGGYLDWVEMFTGETSRYNPGNIIPIPRFTGLFVEPAHCAGFFFMLCVFRLNRNGFNNDRIVSLLLTGMVMTISILGFFALLALLLSITLKSRRRRGLVVGAAIVMVVSGILWSHPDVNEYLTRRISAPLEDASGQARLINGFLDFLTLSPERFYLGYGLGNQELIGSANEVLSGYIYILFYFGLIGGVLFYALLFGMLTAAQCSLLISGLIVVNLMAKPSFTWAFWWIWLAVICIYPFSRDQTTKVTQ